MVGENGHKFFYREVLVDKLSADKALQLRRLRKRWKRTHNLFDECIIVACLITVCEINIRPVHGV